MRERLRTLARHPAARVPAASAATGVIVGLVVAGFDYVTVDLILQRFVEWPLWMQAGAPAVGLALAALSLRYLANGTTPATSELYVQAFHERHTRLSLRELPGKMIAGITTIGFGGSLGLEGPSIYAGSTIGEQLQNWLRKYFTRDEANMLLTAGAAAAIAAIFRTPATAVIFAVEVPYRDDIGPHALLPALFASASSYLTFVAVLGTEPVLTLGRGIVPSLGLKELGGAALIGLLAGLGGRGFAWLIRRAKSISAALGVGWRVALGGVVLGSLIVASVAVYDAPLTAGPGYGAVDWVALQDEAVAVVALLFVLRMIASFTTLAAGGVGGVFIPLTVQGALLGRLVAGLVGQPESGLFPVLGVAAFLGAGYRTPIAAVMFVAETTTGVGQILTEVSVGERYVVPALIAAAVSQLVAGESSVSTFQRRRRLGHLERRFTLPITSALTTDVLTVPPDATVTEFVWAHVMGRRERTVPVVDGGRYLGMCSLEEISGVDRSSWDNETVDLHMRTDLPAGRPSWTLRDAVAAMDESDVETLAVTDADGYFIGVVLASEIVKLDEILDETGG